MLILTGLHNLWQDIGYAARGLAKAPGFLAVALLSLAPRIGANTTIFSVLHAVLYRPLPYKHSDRWMVIWQSSPGLEQPPPVAETVDWKKQNQAFEDLALTSRGEQGSFSGTGGPSSSTNRTSPRISFVC